LTELSGHTVAIKRGTRICRELTGESYLYRTREDCMERTVCRELSEENNLETAACTIVCKELPIDHHLWRIIGTNHVCELYEDNCLQITFAENCL
jgi:hypothetical protein